MTDQTIQAKEAAAYRGEAAAMRQQAKGTTTDNLRALLVRNAELFEQLARIADAGSRLHDAVNE